MWMHSGVVFVHVYEPIGTCISNLIQASLFILYFLFDSGSIDGNNQLVIKGRFQQKQIENVLRRYISK